MTSLPPQASNLRGAIDLSPLVNRPQTPPSPGPEAASGSVPSLIFDATDASFGEVVELSQTVPVIVDLWAEWCQPCKQLSPVLEKLINEFGGRLVLAKVDVDANPQLTQAFQAQSIPTVAAVIGGRPVSLFSGAYPEAQVRDVFEQVLQLAAQNGVTGRVSLDGEASDDEPVEEPLPPHHAEAYEAISRGDYATAIREYETALAQNPADSLAKAGLAQVSLLARLAGKTLPDIRDRAAREPDSLDAALDVADLDVSGGHIEDAFGRLLDLYPARPAEDKEIIRQRILEYFEVVGVTDPRVIRARQRLTSLLY